MVIFGDGRQTRDFTFVSDTARGIMEAGLCEHSIGHTFNLGSGKEIAISELAATVAGFLERAAVEIVHVESRPGDALRLLADSSKAQKILNFEPTVSLKEGLAKLRDWYVSRGKSAAELLEQEVARNWEPRSVPSHA